MSKLLVAPLEAVTDPDLTEPERRVLLVLFSFRGKDTDVIYPGIDSIAARAGYTDKTRISKITGTLARKGWLTKKRRGFTGGNTYKLTVPDSAVEHLAKLDSAAKLEREAKLDQEANSKLDSAANTKLVPEAKNKEQTTEHTIEHKEIQPQEIVNLYNEVLGDRLPKARGLSSKRRGMLNARIREDCRRKHEDWWRDYFTLVSEIPFLLGRGPPRRDTGKPWPGADFEWLIGEDNMMKTLEGKYERER